MAVFLAIAAVPLIGFIGISTDTARAWVVKSRLSSAIDAAALAGGRAFFDADRNQVVTMFFNANFPAGYMGASLSGPAISANEETEQLQLSASATIQTAFMHFFGHSQITVTAAAEVTRQQVALDVVLSIDMSGSMGSSAPGGGTRIEAARNAANTLVNILFGPDTTKEFLNIGLVPWNSKTNITVTGTTFDPALTTTQAVPAFNNPESPSPNPASPPPPVPQTQVFFANNSPVPLLEAPPADWKGCVYTRYKNDGDPNNDADVLKGPITLINGEWAGWQPIGPEGEPVSGWQRCALSVNNNECTPCLGHGITPLTNQKQPITDGINALQSPGGNTNIPQGLGWAWRVLKPEAPFTEAILNPPYKRKQAIVLLSDGENVPGSGDGYKATWGTGGFAQTQMNNRLVTLANNIKADGVIVYVIQFANSGTELQNLLKQVASGPAAPYYHFAPDAATLQGVFTEIANHLSELRLSK
ncbi:MAG: VWA domain-containing protein [Rhodospirillales bacterium]